MHSMASRVVFVMFHGLLVTSMAAATDAARPTLVVRTYEVAPVAPRQWIAAVAQAAVLLNDAGIRVEWVHCSSVRAGQPDSGPARCTAPYERNEVVLRVVNRATFGPRDRIMLGDVMLDRLTGSGTLATIYLEEIERLARDAGVSTATVMARAMAHELGHLLLGTNTHSLRGLMRPVWRPEEFTRDLAINWRIPPDDSARMRRAFVSRLG